MSDELFTIDENKSPRLIWMEKHGITVERAIEMSIDPWTAYQNGNAIGSGSSEEWACWSAARRIGIQTWHKV